MATAVKAAAFAALLRVLGEAFGGVPAWHQIVWWLAVATMVVGNLVALAQRTVKRMLAYSSIAHAGYLLVAVATGTSAGSAAFIFYLVAYTLTTLAAFALLAAKGRDGERDVRIDDLAGLGTRRPWPAFAPAVCLLSPLRLPRPAVDRSLTPGAPNEAPYSHFSRVRHPRHRGRPAHGGGRTRHRAGGRDARVAAPGARAPAGRGAGQPPLRTRAHARPALRHRGRGRPRRGRGRAADAGALLRDPRAQRGRRRPGDRLAQSAGVQRLQARARWRSGCRPRHPGPSTPDRRGTHPRSSWGRAQ